MKKVFKVLMMVLLVLFVGVNTMWGQQQNPTVYMAALKLQSDPSSTGTGNVRITWLDVTGRPMASSLAQNFFTTNPTPSDGFEETAQMLGATIYRQDGLESDVEIGGSGSQMYATAYLYFHAEAEPADGSYLAGWTITEPEITRMTSEMSPADPMGKLVYETVEDPNNPGSWIEVIDEEHSIPLRTPCFKVLPKDGNSAPYYPPAGLSSKMQQVNADPNNLYALFSKYLLSNPVATSANVLAEENEMANLTVTVEINGEAASLDEADFAEFTFSNNDDSEWGYDLSTALASKVVVSDQKTRITIPVTYTYKNTGAGLKNSTLTISMAGADPSVLNVNLSVNAMDASSPEAYWFDGETEMASGALSDMLAVNISGYANPILKLNQTVESNLTFSGKDFTLDLNGNEAQAITVSSGNVKFAYSQYVGLATALTVNGGSVILNGGTFGSLTIGANGTVEQNGATITGAATNAGSLTTVQGTINGGLTSSNTLVMNGGTFKGTTAVTISGGTAAINRGTIEGTICGLSVSGGTATTKKLAAMKGETYSAQRTGGTLIVESGKFDGPLNGTISFTAGFFKTNDYGVSTTGKTEMNVSAGVEYNEGYRYFLGTKESAFANGVGVCRIGAVSYSKLEDAIAYANNNPGVSNIVIFMTNNYTLPAGYYTLPANATIVVPMSDAQEKEVNATAPRVVFNDVHMATPYTSILPTEFRRLTFASGVNMEVFGDIEMTCSQYASNEAYTSQPCGAYGHLVLEEGARLTLQNGSEVRAWGFVTGQGEMDARRGSKVREMFQLGDWKGAMTSVRIVGLVKQDEVAPALWDKVKSDDSDKKIFPVTQYFIQNIESPVKYHPGAVLSTSAAVSEGLLGMSVSMAATDVAIVGVSGQHQAIFLMDQMADADNTWVRKWYDAEHDIQVYDINSAAHIGSMVLDMGDMNLLQYGTVPIRLNSSKFDLPLTSNFKIHLLSGSMDFKQNTSLLPGAEVEVDKEATVTVAMDNAEKAAYDAWVAGGKEGEAPVSYTGAVYVYDKDEWGQYAYCNEYNNEQGKLVTGRAYTKTVRYAPSANNGEGGRPTVRDEQVKPADATINVHGTFATAKGFVYCSESGANIFSSNADAGTFIFNQSAEDAGTRTVHNVKGVNTYEALTFYPAKLKNGVADPAFANTSTAQAGDAYCYTEDKWNIFQVDAHDNCFMVDNYGTYYAKPQAYVAVHASWDGEKMVGNADHTYSDKAGTGRLFILMDGCQWWEVENVNNLYHCIHPQNDTYYYWDEDNEMWKEKKYTITWKNWNGTEIKSYDYTDPQDPQEIPYEVTYGTMAEFLGTNPTRESNIDYTYDFTGWTPALGPVTSDVTYTATYTEKPRKYTIIFQQEGGLEIERQFLTHNEVPVCENVPTKIGHTLVWSPAIAAVTGDATYTATWFENPPTEYEVTFYDYNGTSVLQQSNVAVGATPLYEGATPSSKPATSEFTYEFDHWSPAIEEVSATSIKSYTAVYREVAKTYTVIFQDENGDEIERHDYSYGETPVCSATPTKANTAQYTYSFAWTPQIQAVQAAATYRAVFTPVTNKYTISLVSSISGKCTFAGAGVYDFGTNVTITATPAEGYEFVRWEETSNTASSFGHTVNEDVTFTAVVRVYEPPTPSESLEIPADGIETLTAAVTYEDLIITSDGIHSGQLINAETYLTLTGEAYFDLNINALAGVWYAVAVPWPVEVNGGISVDGATQSLGSHFRLLTYDSERRAANGKTGSNWISAAGSDIMQPGTLYMIRFNHNVSTIRFRMKDGESVSTTTLSVQAHASSTGNDEDAGWNGIANPALFHAYIDASANTYTKAHYGQKYVPVEDRYDAVDMAAAAMIVGEPIFVQVAADKNITVDTGNPFTAPVRKAKVDNSYYEVHISAGADYTDRLYIQTMENKEDRYVIELDLAKAGVSTKVAQMWVNRYNTKLCVNTTAPVGTSAMYPLGIFVPNDGEYQISSVTEMQAGQELYVTLNDHAIWNLAFGPYTASLTKGTHNQYGLKLVQKAPTITTGVDEVKNVANGVRKVLIDNTIYIIREGAVYTINGQQVK